MWWLLACKQPEPAPRDLDQVVHDVWAHYAAEDDDALVVDMTDLPTLVDEAAVIDTPVDGTFTDLTMEEVALADLDLDPATALGMFSIGFVDCTPDEMERILMSQDQDVLYEGNYTDYQREYTSDLDAYLARDTHQLDWHTTYSVDITLVAAYTADVDAGMHYTPDANGPYLFSRTVMPEPAVPEQESVTFDLDFQIEMFYPHEEGMIHLFSMWRHISLAGGLGTDSEGSVRLILNGLHDFDDDTTKICDDGRI